MKEKEDTQLNSPLNTKLTEILAEFDEKFVEKDTITPVLRPLGDAIDAEPIKSFLTDKIKEVWEEGRKSGKEAGYELRDKELGEVQEGIYQKGRAEALEEVAKMAKNIISEWDGAAEGTEALGELLQQMRDTLTQGEGEKKV